jgi:hypothetical protein
MSVMEDLKVEKINIEVQKSIEKTPEMLTDVYKRFNQLKEVIAKHNVGEEPDKTKSVKVFPWVNKTISNAKKELLGTHHYSLIEYSMQNYLVEFRHKFNRRYFRDKLSN